MTDAAQVQADQKTYWNGPAGARWAERQAHTDAMLAPISVAAIAHAAPAPGERVLDTGCGCGETTLAIAEAILDGHVTGIDISGPMLAAARRRGAGRDSITWLQADATDHPFPPGAFDLLFSRFGVMFFGDPVAAFNNLRRAAKRGARLAFACWRPLNENPWMLVPLLAAQTVVPPLPRPGPEDPGPFAFSDPARVTRILTAAGWSSPTFTRFEAALDIAGGAGLEAAVGQAGRIGAAARLLSDQPDAVRIEALAAVREALAPHATGDGRVILTGSVWLVASRNA